jgi:hypothetical protein
MEIFNSIYKRTTNLFSEKEDQFTIEVVDDKKKEIIKGYKTNMTFQVGKSKTILDVKKKIIKNNNKLRGDNFNLRSCVAGKVKADSFPLMRMSDKENPDNNVIQLFIQISNCK